MRKAHVLSGRKLAAPKALLLDFGGVIVETSRIPDWEMRLGEHVRALLERSPTGSDRVSLEQIIRDIRAGCAREFALEGRHVAPLCAARASPRRVLGRFRRSRLAGRMRGQPLLRKLRSSAGSWATCGVSANFATASSTCSTMADAARVPVGIVSNALVGAGSPRLSQGAWPDRPASPSRSTATRPACESPIRR